MMVKRGLEVSILKFTGPLQRYLLTCQAKSASLGRFFCTGQQRLWRGSMNFKMRNSRPSPSYLSKKCQFQDSRFLSTYWKSSSWCVQLTLSETDRRCRTFGTPLRVPRWLGALNLPFFLQVFSCCKKDNIFLKQELLKKCHIIC